MAGRKPRYKSRWNWARKTMTWNENWGIYEEFFNQWRERLANLTDEDRELVAHAMAGLDYKADEEYLQHESNYFYLPRLDPLAYLDGIGDLLLYDRAIVFEIATLKAAKAITLENPEDFYDIFDDYGLDEDEYHKHCVHIDKLFIFTDLKGFWESKNKSLDDIRNLYNQKQFSVTAESLQGWLKYRGGVTKEEMFNRIQKDISKKTKKNNS